MSNSGVVFFSPNLFVHDKQIIIHFCSILLNCFSNSFVKIEIISSKFVQRGISHILLSCIFMKCIKHFGQIFYVDVNNKIIENFYNSWKCSHHFCIRKLTNRHTRTVAAAFWAKPE